MHVVEEAANVLERVAGAPRVVGAQKGHADKRALVAASIICKSELLSVLGLRLMQMAPEFSSRICATSLDRMFLGPNSKNTRAPSLYMARIWW
jgi:hypothetical protein